MGREAQTCRNCVYWEKQPDDHKVGICRRYPPEYDGWAMTEWKNWCGEWKGSKALTERQKNLIAVAFLLAVVAITVWRLNQ